MYVCMGKDNGNRMGLRVLVREGHKTEYSLLYNS